MFATWISGPSLAEEFQFVSLAPSLDKATGAHYLAIRKTIHLTVSEIARCHEIHGRWVHFRCDIIKFFDDPSGLAKSLPRNLWFSLVAS